MRRPTLPRLFAVTDESAVASGRLIEVTEVLLRAGVRLFQARFKSTPFAEQVALGREMRTLTRRHGALLIADDSPELATIIDADGVHLGAGDPSVDEARRLLGNGAIVGVSAYADEARVRAAETPRVDYVGLSSPFPSGTKAKPAPGEEEFGALARAARVPAFAIGGMTPERTAAVVRLGCHGVAAVAALYGAADPATETARFFEAIAAGLSVTG